MTDSRSSHDATEMALPEVDGARCVHAVVPLARCRACVDACPRTAFSLDDDGLTLDTRACDGCGLCAAACPEQAIALAPSDGGDVAPPGPPAAFVAPGADAEEAFAACDRVVGSREPGMVGCLDAIGLPGLARLHADGIRVLVVAHGDCATCPRRTENTLAARVTALTRLTSERGLEPLTLRHYQVAAWRKARDDARQLTRRGLFRRILGAKEATAATTKSIGGPRAAGAILDGRDKARRALFSPQIDAGGCTACGVCVNLCRHGVITLVGDAEGAPRYTFDGLECTGCGLCVDACDKGAVRLQHDASLPRPSLYLVPGQCAGCGNPYLSVAGRNSAETRLCPVCGATSTRQKLFQVLP